MKIPQKRCNKVYDPDEDELMFQCNICEGTICI